MGVGRESEKQTNGKWASQDCDDARQVGRRAGVSSARQRKQRKSSLGLFRPDRPDRDAPRFSCLPCSVAPAGKPGRPSHELAVEHALHPLGLWGFGKEREREGPELDGNAGDRVASRGPVGWSCKQAAYRY